MSDEARKEYQIKFEKELAEEQAAAAKKAEAQSWLLMYEILSIVIWLWDKRPEDGIMQQNHKFRSHTGFGVKLCKYTR